MNQALIGSLVLSLLSTIALEVGFFAFLGKLHACECDKKDFLLVVLVNTLTNPVVVLLYWLAALYTDWNMVLVVMPLELFAVLAEGYCYKRYGGGFRHPYLFSAAANVFSYATGLLIQMFV